MCRVSAQSAIALPVTQASWLDLVVLLVTKRARAQSIVEVVRLLRRPFPYGRELELRLSLCAACPAPLVEMPTADSQVEEAIFALAGHVFLQTPHASACLDALDRLLGTMRLQYLLLFLAFVRAAHYWTKVHPEIEFEDDVKELLATHEALANCILSDLEASSDNVSQSLLDELPGVASESRLRRSACSLRS
jgi:hypothetical protein